MLCMKFVATQTLYVKEHILVSHPNHYGIVLSNTADLVTMEMIQTVFKHIISHGNKIDVNDAIILDREENWFERGVKEAVWVRTKNPSLHCNGSTRITHSHSWDRSMNTLRCFSRFTKSSGIKKTTGRQHQDQLSQPQP